MNKDEHAYVVRQLENELELYTRMVNLLEEIEISIYNTRVRKIMSDIHQNKALVEHKLGR